MDDKKVGELWRRAEVYEGRGEAVVEAWQNIAEDLIRKLVEERHCLYIALCPHHPNEKCNHMVEVLSGFGIDPEEWK